MSRVFVVPSLLVSLVGVSAAAPVPAATAPAPVTFFSTRVGDRMVHTMGDTDHTTVVTEVTETETGRRVTVESEVAGGQTTHHRTVEVSPKGISELRANGRILPEPLWVLKLTPKADGAWTGAWPYFNQDGLATEEHGYTAMGWETVEVPAGKFRAIRVECECKSDDGTRRITRWYAPGLGCVKWSDRNGGSVRKSYTPGRE